MDVVSVCVVDVKVSIKMSLVEVSEAIKKILSLWGFQMPLMKLTVSVPLFIVYNSNKSLIKIT